VYVSGIPYSAAQPGYTVDYDADDADGNNHYRYDGEAHWSLPTRIGLVHKNTHDSECQAFGQIKLVKAGLDHCLWQLIGSYH